MMKQAVKSSTIPERSGRMKNNKSKNKNQIKPKENKPTTNRTLQVLIIIFSIILILSMVLSLTSNF